MATFSTVPTWAWIGASVAFIAVLGLLVWRVRNARAAKAVAEASERENMIGRLALIEDVPPLPSPPSMYTRPEERWIKHPLPSELPPGSDR